jgi:hypothetical protein
LQTLQANKCDEADEADEAPTSFCQQLQPSSVNQRQFRPNSNNQGHGLDTQNQSSMGEALVFCCSVLCLTKATVIL